MTYDWVSVSSDQAVSNSPCWLGCVVVTPEDNDDYADVTLYDGESGDDPKLMKIRSGLGTTRVIRFQPPLKTQRGLYVDIGSDVDSVLIQVARGKE